MSEDSLANFAASVTSTPQGEPIPGRNDQAKNHAGGYVFAVDAWTSLRRFIVIGSEGGTYYVKERELTAQNAQTVLACIKADGIRVVNEVVAISDAGRAPSQNQGLFVLGLCMTFGDDETKIAARQALPKVARTASTVCKFLDYVHPSTTTKRSPMRGWGPSLVKGVNGWITDHSTDSLAYQFVKYRNRNNYTPTDLMRLGHAKTDDPARNILYNWLYGKEVNTAELPEVVQGYIAAQEDGANYSEIIHTYKIPWECLPTQALTQPATWEALLDAQALPVGALLRQLPRLTNLGIIAPLSAHAKEIAATLTDAEKLKKARIHPFAMLNALLTYGYGRSLRGKGAWQPVGGIVNALDEGFYAAFGSVEPSNKRTLLALDVSGSMSVPVSGSEVLTCMQASAAMALVTAATEPDHAFVAFSSRGWMNSANSSRWGLKGGIEELTISPNQRLDDVMRQMSAIPMGGTDCALPMLWATERGIAVDTFIVLTDSETWAGDIQPTQALAQYRKESNIDAKLVVVGMAANGFSIADPTDAGQMDVVGLDSSTPQFISNFSAGRL